MFSAGWHATAAQPLQPSTVWPHTGESFKPGGNRRFDTPDLLHGLACYDPVQDIIQLVKYCILTVQGCESAELQLQGCFGRCHP
jgi:hypothetical protein